MEVSTCEICGCNEWPSNIRYVNEHDICNDCLNNFMDAKEEDKQSKPSEDMADELSRINKRLEEIKLELNTFGDTLREFAELIKGKKENEN